MKLLNRLRELREEQDENTPDEHSLYAYDTDETDIYHLDTIGVGTTTVDDIIRLNVEHRNLQISILHSSAN
ncbi:MAG: hypothetical protein V4575_07400 [Pseudomonadota bacterium]